MPENAPPPAEGKRPAAPDEAAYGWQSDLPTFYGAQPRVVRLRLESFIRDAGTEQIRAWDASIPWLQRECRELVDAYDAARTYTAILEYELPRESRRPDVIILENGVVGRSSAMPATCAAITPNAPTAPCTPFSCRPGAAGLPPRSTA